MYGRPLPGTHGRVRATPRPRPPSLMSGGRHIRVSARARGCARARFGGRVAGGTGQPRVALPTAESIKAPFPVSRRIRTQLGELSTAVPLPGRESAGNTVYVRHVKPEFWDQICEKICSHIWAGPSCRQRGLAARGCWRWRMRARFSRRRTSFVERAGRCVAYK